MCFVHDLMICLFCTLFLMPLCSNSTVGAMESDQQQEDGVPAQPTSAPSSQSKKPDRALYTPKPRQPASKDKAQPQGDVRPKPRPRYSDKARKNARNKKDKADRADKTAPVGEEGAAGGPESDQKEGRLQNAELNGQPDSTDHDADPEGTLQLEAMSIQGAEEDDSWDKLFNDDGDCLDPQLLEEVSVCIITWVSA